MDFDLSDEQEQLKGEVRRFAENEVRPVATQYDVEETYPWPVIEEAAEMGLLGAGIPFEYGAGRYDTLDLCLVIEELFAADPGVGLCLTSTAFGSEAITEFGTEEQKEEYLPPIAEGEAIMGAAISEPDTGSDVSSVSTRAEKEGDEWVINGNKTWITNGSVGDFFVVLCKTDPDAEGRYNGFSQIIVEADRDGFDREKITGKLGIRASDTAELMFDDVRVPESNLVGTGGWASSSRCSSSTRPVPASRPRPSASRRVPPSARWSTPASASSSAAPSGSSRRSSTSSRTCTPPPRRPASSPTSRRGPSITRRSS
jgi:acyl-CoA dehydrogenase